MISEMWNMTAAVARNEQIKLLVKSKWRDYDTVPGETQNLNLPHFHTSAAVSVKSILFCSVEGK